jgi:hypothetical protein
MLHERQYLAGIGNLDDVTIERLNVLPIKVQ